MKRSGRLTQKYVRNNHVRNDHVQNNKAKKCESCCKPPPCSVPKHSGENPNKSDTADGDLVDPGGVALRFDKAFPSGHCHQQATKDEQHHGRKNPPSKSWDVRSATSAFCTHLGLTPDTRGHGRRKPPRKPMHTTGPRGGAECLDSKPVHVFCPTVSEKERPLLAIVPRGGEILNHLAWPWKPIRTDLETPSPPAPMTSTFAAFNRFCPGPPISRSTMWRA